MNRSTLARTAGPVALFGAVLAGLVAISTGGGATKPAGLRPLPVAAGGAGTTRNEATTADARLPSYYGGELVFRPGVTTGLPAEGPSYVLRRDADVARIAALAKALGIGGEVRADEGGWVAGSGDRVLRVMRQAGLPWHLGGADKTATDPAVAVARPAAATPCPSPPPDEKPICGPDQAGDTPTAPPSPPSPPAKPSEDAARDAAGPVFEAAGVTGAVTVHDGWDTRDVSLDPVVGGLPTSGYATSVSVDVRGTVVRAYGSLAVPTFEARYPLLSPEDAVKRGYGTHGGAEPMPAVDLPCPAPCTGAPEPYVTPKPREVTKVRLGLLLAPSYDSREDSFLVPGWLFTVDGEHGEQGTLALPDRYLATPPPPENPDEPVCDPAPCPTKGATEPGGSGGGGSSGSTGSGTAPDGAEPATPAAPDAPRQS